MADSCGAKTRRGTPCRNRAGFKTEHVGVGRCHLHGGAEEHAQVNGMVLLARREQAVMGAPLEIEPQDAMLQCIQIASGEVRYASERVFELESAIGDDGALDTWVVVRDRALDRVMAYTAAAMRAGLEERLVKVAEQQAARFAQAIHGILRDLGVADQPEVPSIVRKHLTLLASPA